MIFHCEVPSVFAAAFYKTIQIYLNILMLHKLSFFKFPLLCMRLCMYVVSGSIWILQEE